jgi:hypothetical protein
MSQTTKPMSERDFQQVIKNSSNDVNKTIGVDGFLVGKVGHRIECTYPDAVTEVYTFKDGSTVLYTITLVYTTSSKEFLSSAERTA